MTDIENVFKVKLYSQVNPSRRIVFDVTPDVSESTSVEYKSIQPVHMPGTIYVYGSTTSRTFDVSNARLISRTKEEASRHLVMLQYLRSWTKPVFGQEPKGVSVDLGNADFQKYAATGPEFQNGADRDKLGAPPEVLYFSAYSNEAKIGTLQHLTKIPVVVSQYTIPFPSDQDYIPTESGVPMPVVINISISLMESHSPVEFERFSISDYRAGKLVNF